MTYYSNMDPFTDLPDPEHDSQFYDGVPSKRFVAWVIDFLIISVFTLVATVMVGIVTLGFGLVLLPVIFLFCSFAYRTLTIAAASATWGMQMMGIELRTQSGHRLELPLAALHTGIFMVLMASGIGWFLTMGAILVTRYNQGLPDLVLGTTAINRPVD